MTQTTNIFKEIPAQLPSELFQTLLQHTHLRIERIVSKGHTTPIAHWYDQAWDEWVIVLQGQAILRYETDQTGMVLSVGDYVLIPAHTRHRVEWTQPDSNTVWLAIHVY